MSSAPRPIRTTTKSGSSKSNEMPETSAQHGKTFAENIETLFSELDLATQWGRPSVLLAVNKSRIGQEKAEAALESRLKKQGLEVARIAVNGEQYDIPQLIQEADGNPVFFVSNLDWGAGDDRLQTYRALNLQREMFVEGSVRAVFWLTTAELANLARHAPDFWAFRHRVVEFISQRGPAAAKLPAGVLLWDAPTTVEIFASPEEGIRARDELLASLPQNPESLSARAELLYSIGHLNWLLGKRDQASAALQAGLQLVDEHDLSDLKSRLLNGEGIVRYDAGEYAEALEGFKQGLKISPASRFLLVNQSTACCMLGRRQEATTAAKNAIRVDATNPDVWERLGFVFAAMGKPDEAVSHAAKAVDLAPRVRRYLATLAVLYTLVDRTDEALKYLGAAGSLDGPPGNTYLQILREAILGLADRADQNLQAALDSGQLSREDLRRDPNLRLLLTPAQLEKFSA
jgi:Tetratricopeptide repeat